MSERTRGDAASIDAFLRCPEVRSFLFYFFFPLSTLLKLLCIAFHRAALPPSIVSPPRSRINFDNTRGYRANYIAKMSLAVEVLREREREKKEKIGGETERESERTITKKPNESDFITRAEFRAGGGMFAQPLG